MFITWLLKILLLLVVFAWIIAGFMIGPGGATLALVMIATLYWKWIVVGLLALCALQCVLDGIGKLLAAKRVADAERAALQEGPANPRILERPW